MITLKKKHNIVFKNDNYLANLIKKFNWVVRYAFNRRKKDKIESLSELERNVKANMNNLTDLDASWIQEAVSKQKSLNIEGKIYFGGKARFFERKHKKIEKYNIDMPIGMRGM